METKKIIIHPGYNKTGSTSIQGTLFSAVNREIFDEHKISFIADEFGYPFNHNLLLQEDEEAKDYFIEKLNENSNTLVFSNESIFLLPYTELIKIKNFIIESCKYEVKFELHLFVREPIGYVNSAYQEGVKIGNDKMRVFNNVCHFMKINYRIIIEELFWKTFGKENVYVHSFEEAIKYKGGLIGYFFNLLDLSEDVIEKLSVIRANDSMSYHAIKILEFFNDVHVYDTYNSDKQLRQTLDLSDLKIIKSGKFKFDKETTLNIIGVAEKELYWIKENYNIDYTNSINKLKQSESVVISELSESEVSSFALAYIMSEGLLEECILKYIKHDYYSSIDRFIYFVKNIHKKIVYELKDIIEPLTNGINEMNKSKNSVEFVCEGTDPFIILDKFHNDSNVLTVEFEFNVNVDTYIQLYYKNETESFIEDRSKIRYVHAGTNKIKINLISDKVISDIRIDLGSVDAIFNMENIKIYQYDIPK